MMVPMTVTLPADSAHPVLRFEAGLRADLEGLIDRVPFMSAADTAEALREHHANQARLDALRLALIARAEQVGVPAVDACTSMEAWLRTQLLVDPGEARRQVRLARRLEDPARALTRAALATGRLDVVAARVILEAVEALPRAVEPALRRRAEAHLVGLAHCHDVRDLRGLARHLEDVINPEGAEQREADALARAEAAASRESWCHVWFDEHTHSVTGSFKTDLVTGRKLARMLEGLMNPARPDPIPLADEEGKTLSADERRGQALAELIARVPQGGLPTSGGCEPVVVVTMTLETLAGGLKAAVLDTGEHLSPGLARRLAARHGVIPAVLGSRGEVLDLGRRARLASKKQRLAMSLQQGGRCAVEGCDRPITWAEAHHLQPWRSGGRTDLGNMVMPCKRHHTMADHPDFRTELIAPGRLRITRRT